MTDNRKFYKTFLKIAIPVALQSLLQSSFSVVDQIMVGQMGEVTIASVGLAGKFASIYGVLLSSIAAVAGILIAQYLGKKDDREVGRSFYLSLSLGLGLAAIFISLCEIIPVPIMSLYTESPEVAAIAGEYLMIVAIGFIPMAGNLLISTYLRCKEKATVPLVATFFGAVMNSLLNYVLIFGHFGFPQLGVVGAAIATVSSQFVSFLVTFVYLLWFVRKKHEKLPFGLKMSKEGLKQFISIIAPIFICEFAWSLGENVYASIYGRIGTDDCAAMTLISSVIVLFIGMLSGISQAAGIIAGKHLGAGDFDRAYKESKRMMLYGFIGSIVLSVLVIAFGRYYVEIFKVSAEVKNTGYGLLIVFAILAPVKVQNMIVGGGIIRSGGKTKYLLIIDLVGTWVFGVPLGLLTAFVFHLPITQVYFFLTLEECVRLAMSYYVFHSKKWMVRLKSSGENSISE